MERRRVVVTGLGAINAIGHNVEETWKSIKEGVCGIDEITNYDKELTKVKIAGEVKNFNAADYLDKKAVRKMDRFTQFGVIAAKEAFKDAGLKIEEIDADRFGVVVSSGIGGLALPYLVSVIMMRVAMAIPLAIGNEVFITYIGLGLPVSTPSLGNLINQGRMIMMNPSLQYQLVFPTVVLCIITVSFYIIGNAFADAADPKNHVF